MKHATRLSGLRLAVNFMRPINFNERSEGTDNPWPPHEVAGEKQNSLQRFEYA